MRTHLFFVWLISFGFSFLLKAEDAALGEAYPKSKTSDTNISLGRFIAHRRPISDRSLVVLLRESQFYILGHANSRSIFDHVGINGDVVLLESAAESFLAWEKQNPRTPFSVFLNSQSASPNEHLNYAEEIKKTILANKQIQAAEADSAQNASKPMQPTLSPVLPPNLKEAAEAKPIVTTPSEEPASSTPWSIIVVLIVAATGLLWLVLKKRN